MIEKVKALRADGTTVPEIMRRTKLSKASVYRALGGETTARVSEGSLIDWQIVQPSSVEEGLLITGNRMGVGNCFSAWGCGKMPSTNTVLLAAAWKTCLLPKPSRQSIVAMEAADKHTDRKQAQGARVPSVVMHIDFQLSLWFEYYLDASILTIPKLLIKVGTIFQSARIRHHE